MLTYESLAEFYEADSRRARSGECDYGVWWRDGKNFPFYRVSYVQSTGEVYAYALTGTIRDRVKVLGSVKPDDDTIYYRTLDAILDGWTDHLHDVDGLSWIRDRIAESERAR
jgi:hypothetical protein